MDTPIKTNRWIFYNVIVLGFIAVGNVVDAVTLAMTGKVTPELL